MLKGKKILLGVSGSIAAYKSLFLLRLLIKEGAEVQIVMTQVAADFVSPLSFSTLSKNKVLINLFDDDTWANHVTLGRWADVMIVAPASCNTIAKMANGSCDNLLLAIYLSATCPVLVAPAMDEDMWKHPATQNNISTLKEHGVRIIPVDNGELASGLTGEGRMAEPENIKDYIEKILTTQLSLKGMKALVTAGPTHEALDPVRFIGNNSSGKMGVYIAEELYRSGAEVTLVLGPSNIKVADGIKTINVTDANEMYNAAINNFETYNIIIMAAAVADYTPREKSKQKIKKAENEFSIELVRTKDILLQAGKLKSSQQVLVGFALETEHEKENAIKKMNTKNADFIVLNSLSDEGAGFGHDTNKITIFDRNGAEHEFSKKSKREVACDIVTVITQPKS
ncbi:MAG: bifunctional phosphopantothenoylcysteine decarboxylase/phosphopantothenate--cysteine ligase CoaBC [Ginsengibacter sp.]